MKWFTADWHLDHTNILDFEPERQKICQNKISKMTDILIYKYNEFVGKNDIGYFLGDFSLRNSDNWKFYERILNKINGKKILILGNHDKLNPFLYVECGFESVHTSLNINNYVLIHDPSAAGVFSDINFVCGHVHKLFKKLNNCINVGIDVWNFYPVNEKEINEYFQKQRT